MIVISSLVESGFMKRIQRKRTKGWRMPSNTVYVGRPSKWGNPYRVYPEVYTIERSLIEYEIHLRRKLQSNPSYLKELKGKNLACWCKLDEPCHADILLNYLHSSKKQL